MSRNGDDAGEMVNGAFGPADCAHNAKLLFQAATEGMLDANRSQLVIQVHGFDAASRNADIILSDARYQQHTCSDLLLKNWHRPKMKILVSGQDTRELGGLTNVQANAVWERGGRFLHIEMSLSVRKQIKHNRTMLKELSEGLIRVSHADDAQK